MRMSTVNAGHGLLRCAYPRTRSIALLKTETTTRAHARKAPHNGNLHDCVQAGTQGLSHHARYWARPPGRPGVNNPLPAVATSEAEIGRATTVGIWRDAVPESDHSPPPPTRLQERPQRGRDAGVRWTGVRARHSPYRRTPGGPSQGRPLLGGVDDVGVRRSAIPPNILNHELDPVLRQLELRNPEAHGIGCRRVERG